MGRPKKNIAETVIETVKNNIIDPIRKFITIEKPITSQINCKDCDYSGVIYKDNKPVQCKCVAINNIKKYLTPIYVNASYSEQDYYKYKKFINKNALFKLTNSPFDKKGKPIIKHFLINNLFKNTHGTVTPTDLVQMQIENHELYTEILNKDIIFLILETDIPNKTYCERISTFISNRSLRNKITWVFSFYDPESSEFIRLYGHDTVAYIRSAINN